MWEGEPIQYYTPSPPILVPSSEKFSYFDRFQRYSPYSMSEEMVIPQSPSGSQSDSDNSVSSTDVYPKEIYNKQTGTNNKPEDIQCRWSSCGICFESLDQLASHVGRVHAASGSGGLFYCGWEGCSRNNKGFNARYKMLVHVRTHTNEKPHQCCQCDKSFSRAENLKIHSRSHSGEKPYICPVPGCQKAYSNSSDRFKHTRTHQVDKPYQCKVPGCLKRYTDPSSLRKHVKTYKHFVSNESHEANQPETCRITTSTKNNHTSHIACKCTHSCVSNKQELIGNLINLNNINNKEIKSWDILEPFKPQPKIFKPYELDDQMDINLPLDLSISRSHI